MKEEENEGWRMGTENDKPKIRIRMKAKTALRPLPFWGKSPVARGFRCLVGILFSGKKLSPFI